MTYKRDQAAIAAAIAAKATTKRLSTFMCQSCSCEAQKLYAKLLCDIAIQTLTKSKSDHDGEKARHRQVEATPEKMYGAALTDKARAECLEQAIGLQDTRQKRYAYSASYAACTRS